MSDIATFANAFEALTGNPPLRWQSRLFKRMLAGDIPTTCDIPTGLGKTSVIPIWLIAVACQGHSANAAPLARRLVYIVNRRTVVDQATTIAKLMRDRLHNPEYEDWCDYRNVLCDLASRLRALAVVTDAEPFAISTLRGEFADNEEWKADPARPAIIIGTIDMIGSKLLFSGYGDRRYGRAHHAGLIGQDALIVHDEAHLTPAFSKLLCTIVDEQMRSEESRRVHVMELSATQRTTNADVIQIEPEDESDAQTGHIVTQRLDARKWLYLHKYNDVIEGLVENAKAHAETPVKVLIYVRSPENAQKVADKLKKELNDQTGERVALLTGTIRGHERDRLVAENPVYRALFDHAANVPHSVFLVSTSAGEVGIDLDADHMVCDLTTLDSMIQRLGRVNRRGGKDRESRVDVVWTDDDAQPGAKALELKQAIAATLQFLQRGMQVIADATNKHLHPNQSLLVSPRKLRTLMIEETSKENCDAAFSPKPTILPLSDILFDNWSLTSIDSMPGRPEVAAYLHGLTTDPPETHVVWRKEVMLLAENKVDDSVVSDWFQVCRIEARERLRDCTDRVREAFKSLLKAHRKMEPKDDARDFPVVLLDERGRVQWSTLSAIVRKPEKSNEDVLHYRTVILPTEAGGLNKDGMLDGELAQPIEEIDVAEAGAEGNRRERWVLIHAIEGNRYERVVSGEIAEGLPEDLRMAGSVMLDELPEATESDGETREMIVLIEPTHAVVESPETARFCQTLDDHTAQTVTHAKRISEALKLPDTLRDALISAAWWHDRGKDRLIWQRYARNQDYCNGNHQTAWAKSPKYLHWRTLNGYRHEFGSLLEAIADEELRNHQERDLILHLIAAHHGWARPHFEPRAFDHEGPRDDSGKRTLRPTTATNHVAAMEVMQRFGRLQQRFGRWGLAWLESLLRCADRAASRMLGSATSESGTATVNQFSIIEPQAKNGIRAKSLATEPTA